MDPKSTIAVITDIKDEEFYKLGTKLGKLKALCTRNQFTLCKKTFLSIQEVGKEENKCSEVVKKLSSFRGHGFKNATVQRSVP